MPRFDRNKPYGTIYGDNEGRAFEQDGQHFNSDGTPWVQPEPKVEVPPPDFTQTEQFRAAVAAAVAAALPAALAEVNKATAKSSNKTEKVPG